MNVRVCTLHGRYVHSAWRVHIVYMFVRVLYMESGMCIYMHVHATLQVGHMHTHTRLQVGGIHVHTLALR